MEHSDWLVFSWDFTLRTITMETVSFRNFSSLPGNNTYAKIWREKYFILANLNGILKIFPKVDMKIAE